MKKKTTAGLAVVIVAFWAGAVVQTQDQGQNNPLASDPEAIRTGMGLYRGRCAECHGMDARGVRGPDLTEAWASGRTDGGLFQVVRNGIPGTVMQPVAGPTGATVRDPGRRRGMRLADDELWSILAYVKTLASPVPTEALTGDVAHGQQIFKAQCALCHKVDAVGGRLGPDLSRVGVSRGRETIERQIRGAAEDFIEGYEPVSLTPPSGRVIHGVKKNEDLFSIQIMDVRGERIQGYLKEDLREVKDETRSAMPAFQSDTLSQNDLNDLMAYLATLRGR